MKQAIFVILAVIVFIASTDNVPFSDCMDSPTFVANVCEQKNQFFFLDN